MATDTARIKLLMDMDDKASAKLKTVGKNTDNFKKKIKDMGPAFKKMAIAGTAAFGALTGVVAMSVKAFQAQERAEKRLEQLTRQTSNATNEQIAALKAQASALQKVGVVGDEVTMFGQSQLATFALQTDTIQTLTPALLDLVVATKGVNATQEDMINIGNLVGKVMTGQVGALSRLGITFSESQAEILKTGNEMERAATLAEVLAGNFGGLNEAMRDTTEGQMQAFKNSFGDMMETLGGAFAPILADIAEKLVPIVDRTAAWIQENPELVKQIVLITGGIAAAIAVLGTLGVVLPAVITGVTMLGTALAFVAANPIVLVVAAVAGLAMAFKELVEVTGGVGPAFEAMGETIVNWWKATGEWIYDKIMKLVNAIKDLGSAAGKKIKGLFDGERAEGGPVSAGKTYLVGERGPELFSPSVSGSIIPNGGFSMAGAGGSTYNLNFSGATFMGKEGIAREIGAEIMKDLTRREKIKA